ncbi:MAG: PKD domain-containing protein [Actinomycetales bacterium]
MYTGREIPMAEVVAAVKEELVKEVGRPQISMQPATRGLIRWPVLFSAPAQHRVTLSITQPLPGDITADPSYSWELGDGQQASGAGHRYTSQVDPTRASSDDYYVKGVYEEPGTHPVRLTLTWSATIHLGDLDVDLDPIVFTDQATARVVSATNRLYDGLPTG